MPEETGGASPHPIGGYVVAHADGSPIDPQACYIVLRLDNDVHAQQAALTYAQGIGRTDPEAGCDIIIAAMGAALAMVGTITETILGTARSDNVIVIGPDCPDCGTPMREPEGRADD